MGDAKRASVSCRAGLAENIDFLFLLFSGMGWVCIGWIVGLLKV